MNLKSSWALRLGLLFALPYQTSSLFAATEVFGGGPTQSTLVAAASNEGELAMKKFRLSTGLKVGLWAAEPLVANIVAFNFDDQGVCYVVETFRHTDGVTDIRGHMTWLDEELASKSVEDRVAIITKHEASVIHRYTQYSDRVRKVWDSHHTGLADQATVFTDGYNGIADGLAAGVLAWRGSIYFANIPHLWSLKDTDADGVADQKKSLFYGFGVRTGFMGHDLHGLTIGPDGKLYFSVGDRGAHVVTSDGRTVSNPETGVVYRSNLDGTGLEIFATGLRNPQDLAFDEWGNLFTGDNNSDGGDPARWVYLVEGGDSGWRIGYQFIDQPNSRGPWIAEKMCYPQSEIQPAFIIPPIANITSGPSGLCYYPGTGALPERFNHHFFLADFTGGSGSSVHSFALKSKGAGFELIDHDRLISEILATDVELSPDGGIYVSDWVKGWNKTGKGRIYRVFDPDKAQDPLRLQTAELLKAGLTGRPVLELSQLLAHPDQRIRLRAQFALVEQGDPGKTALAEAYQVSTNRLARIHGLWGLAQILNQEKRAQIRIDLASFFVRGLKDSDPEIVSQCAKVLGNEQWKPASARLARLVSDPNPRIRFHAAMALGKFRDAASAPIFWELARSNVNDVDPYLRHAAVMGLAALGEDLLLARLLEDPNREVRRVAVLSLRRLNSPQIARFLSDPDPELVTEAARAISDLPIASALPQLATLFDRPIGSPALWRRVVNANFRLGGAENAGFLIQIATNAQAPTSIRVEALQALAQWAKPSGRDRVTGLWRPVGNRAEETAVVAARSQLPGLIQNGPELVQIQAAHLSSQWKESSASDALFSLVSKVSASSSARRAALQALGLLKDPRLSQAAQIAASDTSEDLRKEATLVLGATGDDQGFRMLQTALETGSRGERQVALTALGNLGNSAAETILAAWLDRLSAGKVPTELQLDLLEAAKHLSSPSIRSRLERFEVARKADDPIGQYRECIEGGDADLGKKIFIERADVTCLRCHKIHGEGGEVGPDLTGIISRHPREYILESIVAPNRQIASGFESLLLTMKDGTVYAGAMKSENDAELEINSPEEGLIKVKKAEIASRERGLSGMPEELRQMLTKQDLRNLVEFLSTVK